jgi:hypothetical protein
VDWRVRWGRKEGGGGVVWRIYRINGETGDADSLCLNKKVVERVDPFRNRGIKFLVISRFEFRLLLYRSRDHGK